MITVGTPRSMLPSELCRLPVSSRPLVAAAIVSFGSGRQEATTLDRDTVRAFLLEVLRRLQNQPYVPS